MVKQLLKETIIKSGISLFYKSSGAGLALLNHILIVQYFGLAYSGLYFSLVSAAFLFAILGRFGQDEKVVREIPAAKNAEQVKVIYWVGLVNVLVFSAIMTIVGGVVVSFLPYSLSDKEMFRWALVFSVLPFNLLAYHANLIRAFRLIKYSSFFVGFGPHLLLLPMTVICGELAPNQPYFLFSFPLMHIILAAIAIIKWFLIVPDILNAFSGFKIRLSRIDLNFLFIQISEIVLAQLHIWLLTIFASAQLVGVWGVLYKLSSVLLFIPDAADSILSPQIAKLYKNQEITSLRFLVRRTAQITLCLALFPAIVLALGSETVLTLFDKELKVYAIFLIVLVTVSVFQIALGPVKGLLDMSRYESLHVFSNLIALLLGTSVFLAMSNRDLLLASVASFCCMMTVRQLFLFYFVRRKLRIWPSFFTFN